VELDVVDPLLAQSEILKSVTASLEAAGVRSQVRLHAGSSPQTVEELAARSGQGWDFFFIDGSHDAPGPFLDAMICARLAGPDALILFHDLACPDVAHGLDYLRDRGWRTRLYHTTQIMGAAWRGSSRPIDHQPDPKVLWSLPEHLQGYLN
jgi:predicted O-methyltransferase YrrM